MARMRKHDVVRAMASAALLALVGMAGCGGADFGGAVRNSSFDSGLGGSGYGGYGGQGSGAGGARGVNQQPRIRGAYPRVELTFELPEVAGNPFDYTVNDVLVTFGMPDSRTLRVPAFFDGGKTWKVRFTPDTPGRHTVAGVTLNGNPVEPQKLDKRDFDVGGSPSSGFVRRDPRDRTRFALDNGAAYYPLGMNIGWADVPVLMDKAGKAGMNWSRVWMCHWSGMNLDWVMNKKLELGTLDLDAAKRWDAVIDAAEKAGIRFQMVLQHHGQYSTRVNPNWGENPWNSANGGFLKTPGEFFINRQAIELSRAKYRYIIARWGSSPSVMAWELFNEVEWTDSVANRHVDEVAAWHAGMADFLRKQDPFHHLVTSSSSPDLTSVWQAMDYLQPHAYQDDMTSRFEAIGAKKLDKPLFYGEVGPAGSLSGDDGAFLRPTLWAGIMSQAAGAPQYWAWDTVDAKGLYPIFRSAADFLAQSGLAGRRGLVPGALSVTTDARGPLAFAPGGGWSAAKSPTVTVLTSGAVEGIGGVPDYLHGTGHRDLLSGVTFKTAYPEPGTFAVDVARVARAGAHVRIVVDGKTAAEKQFPAADGDKASTERIVAQMTAGPHTVLVENTGADWVVVRRFVLDPYAPSVAVSGKSSRDYAVAWLHARKKGGDLAGAKLAVAGLSSGSYTVGWWDITAGKPLKTDAVRSTGKGSVTLAVPSGAADLAVSVAKQSGKPSTKPKAQSAGVRGDLPGRPGLASGPGAPERPTEPLPTGGVDKR